MLTLVNVAMRYGDGPEILHELNLTLVRGEFMYLMGPTGAGKSSLLRLLGLMQMPCCGEFTLFDKEVASLTSDERSKLRRRIGIVFQDLRLLDHLSTYENIALPLRINGFDEGRIEDFVPELLSWIGLSAAIDDRPTNLSRGQRQLIAVARAIVVRPDLLLCDEPTSNLDSKSARRLMHLFAQLCKLGATVVLATHNDDLVDRYRHPILRMSDGHLKGWRPTRAKKVPAGPGVGVTDAARPSELPGPDNEPRHSAADTTPSTASRVASQPAFYRSRRPSHRRRVWLLSRSRRRLRRRRPGR
jgi:cell division transport system ATP-binding protein